MRQAEFVLEHFVFMENTYEVAGITYDEDYYVFYHYLIDFKIEYFIADNEWLVGGRKTDFDSVRLFIESLIGLGIIKEEL